MLEFMKFIFGSMRRKSQEKWRIDIVISLGNIGVRMMQYIVLDSPNGRIGPDQIECVTK